MNISIFERVSYREDFETLVLVGHSACGKSALLEHLGCDRGKHDADVFLATKNLSKEIENLYAWVLQRKDPPLVVFCNNRDHLKKLLEIKRAANGRIAVAYIKRPASIIFQNMQKENTDGHYHDQMPSDVKMEYYDNMEQLYMGLADAVIYSLGENLQDIATAVVHLLEKNTGMKNNVNMKVQEIFSEDDLFNEFNALRALSRFHGGKLQIATQEKMRALTAGGYQVYTAEQFPPIPLPGSTCHSKLSDLKWQREHFNRRSVLEVGSQLGFFSFIAAGLGASSVVGIDINNRFVEEANKIALNYVAQGKLESNLVRFRTDAIEPCNKIVITPEIIILSSVLHWWIIHTHVPLEEIVQWMYNSCSFAVYFEGCVSASETVMVDHGVAADRISEDKFLNCCATIFSSIEFVGRCTYNDARIVVRLYK